MRPAFVGFKQFGVSTLPVFIILPPSDTPLRTANRGGALRIMRAPTSGEVV